LSDSTLSVDPLREDKGDEDVDVSESGEALLSAGLLKPLEFILLRMSTLRRRDVVVDV